VYRKKEGKNILRVSGGSPTDEATALKGPGFKPGRTCRFGMSGSPPESHFRVNDKPTQLSALQISLGSLVQAEDHFDIDLHRHQLIPHVSGFETPIGDGFGGFSSRPIPGARTTRRLRGRPSEPMIAERTTLP